MSWFAIADKVPYDDGTCEVADKVFFYGGKYGGPLGAQRLLTLYCNKFNFTSAAVDLGIKYGALMKWFQRWRAAAIADGLTPRDLGLIETSTVSQAQ